MRKVAITALVILFFIGCKEDPELKKQNYPIFTTSVGEIDATGATFELNIIQNGNLPIHKFGFLWGLATSYNSGIRTFASDPYNFIIDSLLTESFSLRVPVGIDIDPDKNQYAVQAYVITTTDTLYSNLSHFYSLGASELSSIFSIDGISSDEGLPGDTVTIDVTSKLNWAISPNDISITFGFREAKVISIEDNKIKFIVPDEVYYGNHEIAMSLYHYRFTFGYTVISP